jgi:hypothetical protein
MDAPLWLQVGQVALESLSNNQLVDPHSVLKRTHGPPHWASAVLYNKEVSLIESDCFEPTGSFEDDCDLSAPPVSLMFQACVHVMDSAGTEASYLVMSGTALGAVRAR